MVALANELAASIVVVSRGEEPGKNQAKELILTLDALNKKLTDVMQDSVQMVRVGRDLILFVFFAFF